MTLRSNFESKFAYCNTQRPFLANIPATEVMAFRELRFDNCPNIFIHFQQSTLYAQGRLKNKLSVHSSLK